MRLQPKPCEPKAFRCDRCGHEIGVVANGTAIVQNTVIWLWLFCTNADRGMTMIW